MMKKTKTNIIIIIVIAVLIILTVLFFLFKDKLIGKKMPVPESNVDDAGNKITWSNDAFPLKKGSYGTRVKQLQAGLNMKGENLVIDGKFGKNTLAALKANYNIEQVTEYDYNQFIKPNLVAINDYIRKSTQEKTLSASGANSSPVPMGTVIGRSVQAAASFQGFNAEADSDLGYIIDERSPINYITGQYIGIVERETNGWLQCVRSNGSRVFVLKNNVKPV